MSEIIFPQEVNEILSEIYDSSGAIYENIRYLHHLTGWTYGEIVDKVSRNCDYYGTANVIRFFAADQLEYEQKSDS